MKVPQLSPWIGKEEYEAIAYCFENNWITEGPKSKEFSQKLLELTGAKYGVFAPNGTLALYLGLRAMGIGQGDEVIVPDFTFIASGTSVEMTGAIPVFVDVNRTNFQIDLDKVEKLVNKKTKAIMPVHIYGTVCNMHEVMNFAKKHNLKVIEDAAEAIAVHWKGKHSGTFGDVGIFSFFADKTITTAEGGFVVTDDEKIYEKLLYLRNQGRVDRGSFIHPRMGYNFRMTDIQNAMGLVQLGKLEEIVKRKERIKKLYMKQLEGVKGIQLFEPEVGAEWIPFRMCILCKDAHGMMAYMKTKGIEPRTFFYPLHKQPAFSYLKGKGFEYKDSDFPNTIYGYEHGVCLPIFPTLSDEQVVYICDSIKEFQGKDLFYKYYDLMFKDKDYSAETNMVFALSRKYGLGNPRRVLEIGCGTGNHTMNIALHKVDLVAIDVDREMVKMVKHKIERARLKRVSVLDKPVEELKDGQFDLALALFNVVNYIDNTSKLESFFKGVIENLKPGGIFVFDSWNGAAAVVDPPKSKKTVMETVGKTVETSLTSETDFFSQVTTLNYSIKVRSGRKEEVGGVSLNQTLWMPREILSAIERVGFEVLVCSPLMKPDQKATEKDWKIMFCVRKK